MIPKSGDQHVGDRVGNDLKEYMATYLKQIISRKVYKKLRGKIIK